MDKLAGDIIGLPIMTVEGGDTIAHVEDMIVDPARRQVLALVVNERQGIFTRRTRAIPFGRITANGPDAVLVQNARATLDLERDPVLRALDNAQKVQGTTIMSDNGHKIGTATDMLIDDQTGEIKNYQVKMRDGEMQSVPADGVISIGRDALYVTADAATALDLKKTRVVDSAGTRAAGENEPEAAHNDAAARTILEENTPPGAGAGGAMELTNILGGFAMNTRLLFGIVILVLGILILVYPTLLPLIAGISLIVLGLWVALQNAPTGSRP